MQTLKIKVTVFHYGTLNQHIDYRKKLKIFIFKCLYLSNPLFKTVPYIKYRPKPFDIAKTKRTKVQPKAPT